MTKHPDYIKITHWPMEVGSQPNGSHAKQFKLFETKAVWPSNEAFDAYFRTKLATIDGDLGREEVFHTSDHSIAVIDNESGVISISEDTYIFSSDWYFWVHRQHLYGNITIEGLPPSSLPPDTPLIRIGKAMSLLGMQIYTLVLELEYEPVGDIVSDEFKALEEPTDEQYQELREWQADLLVKKAKQYATLLRDDDSWAVVDDISQHGTDRCW